MLPARPEHLQVAIPHVAAAELDVFRQQGRIVRLRAVRADTTYAEALLETFRVTLRVMRKHLAVEASESDSVPAVAASGRPPRIPAESRPAAAE